MALFTMKKLILPAIAAVVCWQVGAAVEGQ